MSRRIAYGLMCVAAGLALGVLWSPMRGESANCRVSGGTADRHVTEVEREFGEETAQFVAQFKDMRFLLKKDPLVVAASPDGRFVIRIFRSNELVASELRYPVGQGVPDELVRHYSFASDGKEWFCNFGRSVDGSKLTTIHFGFADANGRGVSYIDSEADGRWDRLTEDTPEGPRFYRRDGLRWVEFSIEESRPSDDQIGETAR